MLKRTSLVIFLFQISLIQSGPVDKNVSPLATNSVYSGPIGELDFMKKHKSDVSALFDDIKKLKSKKSSEEIRRIATVGILAGALKTERSLNERLAALARDFFVNFNSSTVEDNMEKLFNLEQTMERDKRAMEILGNALDFAIHSKNLDQYKEDMEEIGRNNEATMLELAKKKLSNQITKDPTNKGEKVGKMLKHSKELNAEFAKRKQDVRISINKHMYTIHSALKDRENKVIRFLKTAKSTPKTTAKPALGFGLLKNLIQPKTETTQYDSTTESTTDYTDAEGYQTFPPSQKESRLAGLFNRLKRQDITSKQDDENEVDGEPMDGDKQNSNSESESSSEEQGGLLGLIANLSGGDEGSDVGALIGALTGVVTNLFGPGGLDVPSLIGTGVGLLAGLLSGDDNFGKVLGTYAVVAVDAASGGGGANLNGEFFGQFLGTVLAGLSANPEDEDLPLTPGIFIENFFKGSRQSIQKADNKEGGEGQTYHKGGSDIFGFIVHVVSSIVGGVTSLILNTSLGSSGGSSQGSADLSGGSSGASSSSHDYPVADEHHH
ncbi:uncharacterized protein LOC119069655 [Bradysia coprophila]|uniref:uncharacterized protein LOC119069655 n=1 Tax=Bradysia coprophila TaxID=38358 RepID=UPI00187DD3E4|nr:uncharacterized protein LOC119069655 [Bradysia coprophila]